MSNSVIFFSLRTPVNNLLSASNIESKLFISSGFCMMEENKKWWFYGMILVLTGEKKHSKIKKKCASDTDKCAETKAVILMLCWLPNKGMTADPR